MPLLYFQNHLKKKTQQIFKKGTFLVASLRITLKKKKCWSKTQSYTPFFFLFFFFFFFFFFFSDGILHSILSKLMKPQKKIWAIYSSTLSLSTIKSLILLCLERTLGLFMYENFIGNEIFEKNFT